MPLLLLDLDNTLLPRDAAFRAWAEDFLAENHLPAGDLDWLVMLDGSGYVPRSTVLGAAKRRYGIDRSVETMLKHYRLGINSHIQCPDSHVEALREARAAGWTIGIVSNGGTLAQLEKIRLTGLAPLVDGWVISEEARCLKPDPLIFEIAARRCGYRSSGDWTAQTWMVGDYGPADIAGAAATGLRSAWLHHGRPWAERAYRPTISAPTLPEAVQLIVAAAERSTAGRGFAAASGLPHSAPRPRPSRGHLAVPASRLAPPPTKLGRSAPAATVTAATAATTATATSNAAGGPTVPSNAPGMPVAPLLPRGKPVPLTQIDRAAPAGPATAQARWGDPATAAG
ncbi:HAD family hydrolase [Streptomyces sp. TLI_171]|uniref:HAD family hydrolase n=1 Tax=Streptomyces sp. TLI_171 TaxID=1938859 RepID=UPI0015D52AA2|nr:HAD family hydrolase [Streptomyces sp. TLI_171]